MSEPLPEIEVGEWRTTGALVWWETTVGQATVVVTTRTGGVSAVPYEGLNLGFHVGDDPAAVAENRAVFWTAAAPVLPAPVLAEQVHGARVALVDTADAGRGWHAQQTAIPAADALVTRAAGLPLAVLVADCAPVAIVAPNGVLAVVHAGWRGLVAGVLPAALRQIEALGGASPRDCQAVVGPCIRGCCYEVGEAVWRHFPASCLAPASRPNAHRLDLAGATLHQLRDAGVPDGQIRAFGLCTACQPELFFSHRRATKQGLPSTGRMALVALLTGDPSSSGPSHRV
jgi:YfiH family protein